MNAYRILFLLVVITGLCLGPNTAAAERLPNYVVLKGGVYSPSATFELSNLDIESTFDADTETGFAGELAFGRFVLPNLALEFGVGYFRGQGSFPGVPASAPANEVDFDVIPILLTAKVLIPVGTVDPYGEIGAGAYFTSFDFTDNANSFSGDMTLGLHVGGGLNVNVTEAVFFGAEIRYVWAEPSFGGETIRLNDDDYELQTFELNGFTTMLALGYSF